MGWHRTTASGYPPPHSESGILAKVMYPFVLHAFADVDLGQVGLLEVGNPKGTATHG